MSSRGRRKMHMPRVQPLTPLMEGPYLNSESEDDQWKKNKKKKKEMMSWVTFRALVGIRKDKDLLPMRLNLKLMLGVLACPLAPIPLPLQPSYHHFSIKDSPTESTCARYIVHQYLAATGWMRKREKKMKSLYVSGKVKMVGCESVSRMGRNGRMVVEGERNGGGESGCFVLWKMSTAMWLVEMVVEGCKVVAGSDGKVVWRHLPWSGTHLARGPLRPLRRIIQGLEPNTTASMFAKAQCVGEKVVGNDDCFVLKVCTDREAIEERNEASAEVIRHVLYGYFSQRSGLLIYIEDSHLTRVQSPAMETMYWETTFGSSIEDYREVDGVLIAHRGTTTATVFRFGEARDIHSRTMMEETWRIDDVVFDVPGLSCDCFIPPNDVLSLEN